jgi:hypothetical protein
MVTQLNTLEGFLEDFRATITTATVRLREISDGESGRRSAPGKWTAKEILGHLIDSAANNHQRFVRAQFSDDLVFPGYEQEKWVSAQRYNDRSWSDLVQLWNSYNLHLHHVISVIPEAILTRTRTNHNLDQIALNPVDKREATTLEYFVRDYLVHLKHHLDQIFYLQDSHKLT